MTFKELETKMNEMFKDKEYEGYNGWTTKSRICEAIKKELGVDEYNYDIVKWVDYRTYIMITYLDYHFATIDIHKGRKTINEGWYKNYEWYIKDLNFNIAPEDENKTIEEEVERCKEVHYKATMERKEYKKFATIVFKHLQAEYGLSEYETKKVCEYINNNYYDFEKAE